MVHRYYAFMCILSGFVVCEGPKCRTGEGRLPIKALFKDSNCRTEINTEETENRHLHLILPPSVNLILNIDATRNKGTGGLCTHTQGNLIKMNYRNGEQVWETSSGTQSRVDIYWTGSVRQQGDRQLKMA